MIRPSSASLLLTIPLLFAQIPTPKALQGEPDSEAFAPKRSCADDGNAYNGYHWKADRSVCVPGMISIFTWYTPAPPFTIGGAVWYDPWIMGSTARYRNLDLEGYLDGVALMSPADIGRTVWLRRPGLDWEGPFLVVDSAARQDMWPVITHRREVVEIGFDTAARWGMVDATHYGNDGWGRPYTINQWRMDDVEVLKMDQIPPWIEEHDPLVYDEWWGGRAYFVNPHDIRRPYQLNPDHPKFPGWKWMATDPPTTMSAYDDWFEFLWPRDVRFEFELPDNYIGSEPELFECVVFYECLGPGIFPFRQRRPL